MKLSVHFYFVYSVGRDAVRELTGFFFAADNTLTVYEFRKFGKTLVSYFFSSDYVEVTALDCWLLKAAVCRGVNHVSFAAVHLLFNPVLQSVTIFKSFNLLLLMPSFQPCS